MELDALIKRYLDGDVELDALPGHLRAEAEAARRVVDAADRGPVPLSPDFDARVMAAVRLRARRGGALRRAARWLAAPREVRLVLRPWSVGALAAAAALVLLLVRPGADTPATVTATDGVAVRFVLHAPDAQSVSLAGTFNQWDATATPLVRAEDGLWTATLLLPRRDHQYAFVVDGERWVPDPAAPAVDDGFGRQNSVLALNGGGRAL